MKMTFEDVDSSETEGWEYLQIKKKERTIDNLGN